MPGFGAWFGPGSDAAWISLVVAVILFWTAALRLVAVLVETADAAGRLKQISGTVLGALVWTAAQPGRAVQSLTMQTGPWPGVFHPAGVGIAFGSAVLAWMIATVPVLGRWSDRASLVLACGLLAYAACAVVVGMLPPIPGSIRRIWEARQRIARLIRQRVNAVQGDGRDELERLARKARLRIDQEIVPAFLSLVRYNLSLRDQVRELARSVPPPEPRVLAPVRERYENRVSATEQCVQLAADAEAHLLLLLQGPDEREIAVKLNRWTRDLEQLLELINDVDKPKPESEPSTPEPGWEPEPGVMLTPGDQPDPQAAQGPLYPASLAPAEQPDADFVREVEWTLRHLNNANAVGKAPLPGRLARSVAATYRRWDSPPVEPTALDKGHALRDGVIAAIERLKVADKPATEQPFSYHILWDAYVKELENYVVMQRHGIPTTNFYRIRKEAVAAVANELWQRERRLSVRNPVAIDYLG